LTTTVVAVTTFVVVHVWRTRQLRGASATAGTFAADNDGCNGGSCGSMADLLRSKRRRDPANGLPVGALLTI
jgi:hypothetical protein